SINRLCSLIFLLSLFLYNLTVREDDDVILPCSLDTNENIESMLFDWVKEVPRKEVFMYRNRSHYNNGLPGQDVEFKGRVSHYPEELKYGNASIRLKQTRLEDKGTYTCIFPEIKPSEKISRIELVVGECCYEPADYLQMKQSACTSGRASLLQHICSDICNIW
uniref:Ig-like domain-containing protein n=1 Tax=Pundamilia nyererei TaxID=303518 RepID=A0A3B4F4D2_9CICH